MKKYECVQLDHHKKIPDTTKEYLRDGWHLHTYQTTGIGMDVKHYLLFEKGRS